MKTVAVYATKGGVGKTTSAVNLGWSAAHSGLRTLIWDLDPQGASSYLLRIKPKLKGGAHGLVSGKRLVTEGIKASDFPGLDLLPADFSYRNLDLELDDLKKPEKRLKRLLSDVADEYDLVLLDCPPSVTLASESVLHAASLVVTPLLPAPMSARTADQLTDFIASLEGRPPSLFGFFSMVDKRRSLHRELVEELPRRHSWMSRVCIPSASVIEQMGVKRMPLPAYAASSPAAHATAELWEAVARAAGLTAAAPDGAGASGVES